MGDRREVGVSGAPELLGRPDRAVIGAEDGDPDAVFSRNHLLANISLYWFTGAIGSSFWPYYARMHGPWPVPEGGTVDVPTGYCEFPREIRAFFRPLRAP